METPIWTCNAPFTWFTDSDQFVEHQPEIFQGLYMPQTLRIKDHLFFGSLTNLCEASGLASFRIMWCHQDFALRVIEQKYGCQHSCATCESWEFVKNAQDTLQKLMHKYNENFDGDTTLPIYLVGDGNIITVCRSIPYDETSDGDNDDE